MVQLLFADEANERHRCSVHQERTYTCRGQQRSVVFPMDNQIITKSINRIDRSNQKLCGFELKMYTNEWLIVLYLRSIYIFERFLNWQNCRPINLLARSNWTLFSHCVLLLESCANPCTLYFLYLLLFFLYFVQFWFWFCWQGNLVDLFQRGWNWSRDIDDKHAFVM